MIYATLGRVNHWQPSELDDMDWADLVDFHKEAEAIFKAIHGIKD